MSDQNAQVSVVGAGLAGLVAAYTLQRAGATVTVYESSDVPGGRLKSRSIDGQTFQPMSQTLPSTAPALSRLLREIGAIDKLRRTPLREVHLFENGKNRTIALAGKAYLRGMGRTRWSRPPRLRRVRDIIEWLAERVGRDTPAETTRLDDRSVADFTRLYLGNRAHQSIIAPLLDAEFALDSYDTSRLTLTVLMNPWAEPEISRLNDASFLIDALADSCADLRVNRKITRLDEIDTPIRILAVPATDVAGWVDLSPREEEFFKTTSYARELTLVLKTDGTGESTQTDAWIPPRQGGSLRRIAAIAPNILLLSARLRWGIEHWEDEDAQLTHSLLNHAELVRPGLRDTLHATEILRLEQTVPRFDVGHYRRLATMHRDDRPRAANRGVFFAGDYLVGPHIEGAIVSGMQAARDALMRLGVKPGATSAPIGGS